MSDSDIQYLLIGADNRQYGPITQEQVETWIRDGRANRDSLVQVVGQPSWVPLSSLESFRDCLADSDRPPVILQGDPRKSKLVAGLLGILLGSLGVHRFYLGYTEIGVIQIIVTVVTCGTGAIWGLIEGILILVGTSITTDAAGQTLRE